MTRKQVSQKESGNTRKEAFRGKAPAAKKREDSFFVGGRNAVAEALATDSVKRLFVKRGDGDARLSRLLEKAKSRGIAAEVKDEKELDALLPDLRHQGIVAEMKPYEYKDLDDVLTACEADDPFLILLDGVEDVRNLGAIIRTAECAGAAAVLLPSHKSASVTAATMKTAAGACQYLPVCRIGNIAQTLENLKKRGFWVVGTAMDGESLYFDANLSGKLVIVMGAEGRGMSRLTREMCDFCVRIPMKGKTESLNVSVAAALLIYEAAKRRL